jgi:putative CocE/NonD family hydrolase
MVRHSPAAPRQEILLGPWEHGEEGNRHVLGGVDFSSEALMDVQDVRRQWFDRWLKPERQGDARGSRYFLTGVNEWRDSDRWPPGGVEASWFLDSGGRANAIGGDGSLSTSPPTAEARDTFLYDPDDPVVTFPAVNPFLFEDDPPLDHTYLGSRDDVLFYTSAPMEDALTIAGRPSVVLYASSDAPDTDWFASLHDVHPTGSSVLLGGGRLRARFRTSLEVEELMAPGQVYEFGFELRSCAHTFRPGHRIRLLVTSSDFPMYDRNPNTGHPIGQDSDVRVARNALHYSPARPSRLVLPVLTSR